MLQIILNYVGIAVFAASGATVGVRKGFDLFGIATLGVLTGVGGGVLRDLLLDRPPYSIQHWPNITVALLAVAIDYFEPQWVGVAVGSALATLLRLAALAFHWRLPTGPRELITPNQ